MRDCRLDVEGLVVERLQLLVVLLGSVHLDLQSVNLQQLSPFLEIIFAVLKLISRHQVKLRKSELRATF